MAATCGSPTCGEEVLDETSHCRAVAPRSQPALSRPTSARRRSAWRSGRRKQMHLPNPRVTLASAAQGAFIPIHHEYFQPHSPQRAGETPARSDARETPCDSHTAGKMGRDSRCRPSRGRIRGSPQSLRRIRDRELEEHQRHQCSTLGLARIGRHVISTLRAGRMAPISWRRDPSCARRAGPALSKTGLRSSLENR